ncbi:hypothetical protein ACEPAF_3928 [Sanghuangporus sanghuang]
MPAALGNSSLYLSLFFNPQGYHWSLLAKTSEWDTSPETLFHATNKTGFSMFTVYSKYSFEQSQTAILSLRIGTLSPTMTSRKLEETPATVPVLNGDPNFTCLTWAKLALHKLHNKRIITCYNIDALANEAVAKAARYRGLVETGDGTWGYAISALSR